MNHKFLLNSLLVAGLITGSSAFAAHKASAKPDVPVSGGPVSFAPVTAAGAVGNWSYRCTFKGNGLSEGPQSCLIQQELVVQQKGQNPVPLGMVVLARTLQNTTQKSLSDRPWHVVVVAPSGLSLQKQPQISVDKSAPVSLSWENCANSGCISGADLTNVQAKGFRNGTSGTFMASRMSGTNDLKISFSLKGIDMAMDRVQSWIDRTPFH